VLELSWARQTFSTVSEIQHAIIPNKTQRNFISKEQLVLAGTPFTEILIFLQLVTNATQLRASAMLRA
jgi:hypothetical protein